MSGDAVATISQGLTWNHMSTDPIARVVMPLLGPQSEQLGYVKYKIDVTQVTGAYASGLVWFGLALALFGAAVFAIPAAGFVVQRNLAERSHRNAKYLASFDALTGLLNRRGFIKQVQACIDAGRVSHMAYIDADNFKAVNDTYGHAVGDAFLKYIADEARRLFPSSALLARLGGDEFVIAIKSHTDIKAQEKLDQLLEQCTSSITLNDVTITPSISIGLCTVGDQTSLETALKDADTALYTAKSDGGGRIALYTQDMGRKMEERRALEARLRDAIANEDFFLHYQPLVDASTKSLVGHEALLRLTDISGKLVPPDHFIPLAEEMGLITDIGAWVLREATRAIAELDDTSMIAINLSAEQFKSGGFVETVSDALSRAGLPAHRLELEITESLILEDSADIAFQLDALKEMGVSIAMDDFGTESIISLGDKLGMDVTAEGIETRNQLEILANLGCDVVQGYYFGKPNALGVQVDTKQASTG